MHPPLAAAVITLPFDSPRAIALGHSLDLYWAAQSVLSLGLPAALLWSGTAARIGRICTRLVRGWYGGLLLFAAVYLLLDMLVKLPIDYARRLAFADFHGRIATDWGGWLLEQLTNLAAPMLIAMVLLWIPYAWMRRSPPRWWLWSTASLAPMIFCLFVAQPVWMGLTTTYRPLDGALRSQVDAMAARCGNMHPAVFIGGDDSTVIGLGPSNRLVLQHDLLTAEDPAQVRFTLGHELKHYLLGDNWAALAIVCALLLAGFWLTHAASRWTPRFARLGDAGSLPLLVLCMTALWLAVTPAFLAFERHIEREADRFSLELTHQNDAAARLFASWTGGAELARPGRFEQWFRDSHPSIAERVAMAESYRPWLDGEPLRYGHVCKP